MPHSSGDAGGLRYGSDGRLSTASARTHPSVAGSCLDPIMRVYSAGLLMVVGVVGAGLLAPAQGQAVPEMEAAACESIDSKNECTDVASCAWLTSCSGTASNPDADCAAGVLPSGDCPDGCDRGETCAINRGVDDCECIDPWPAQAESSPQCINATLSSDKQELATCLPLSYGAGRCDIWDSQTVGLCVDEFGNVPDSGQGPWCRSSWCWVNGTTCMKPRDESKIQWSGDTGIADDLFYRFAQELPSAPSLLPPRPPLPLLLLQCSSWF